LFGQYAGDKVKILLKIIGYVVRLLTIQENYENSGNDSSNQQSEQEVLGYLFESNSKNQENKTKQCVPIKTMPLNSVYNVNADILLEALVWMVIKIAPHSLFLNLSIIQYCRHPQLFSAEQLYYLTMLTSAVTWVNQDKNILLFVPVFLF
jgi:hypothetical protein